MCPFRGCPNAVNWARTHVITAFCLFMLLLLFARILIWTAFLNSSICVCVSMFVWVCLCMYGCVCVFRCLLSVQRTQCPLMENLSAISSRARCCCYFLYFFLAVFEWEKNVERVGRPPALRPSELFTLGRAKRQHDKGRRRRGLPIVASQTDGQTGLCSFFSLCFFAVAFPASKSFGDMFMYMKCIWILHKILFQAINPWLPKCFMCSCICCCAPIPTHTHTRPRHTCNTCLLLLWSAPENMPPSVQQCVARTHTHTHELCCYYYCSPNQT